MASSVLQPIADVIASTLTGLSLPTTIKVPQSSWVRDHVNTPGAEIELPDITRTHPDEAERQLGTRDFHLDFLVTIWFDLREPTTAQQRLAAAIEAFIDAIDSNPTLGLSFVEEAKVAHATRVYEVQPDKKRALVGYETAVEVLVFRA